MNYFEEIKKGLIAKGAKGSITKDSDLRSVGIDSLDLMDSVIELETKLNIQFSDETLMAIKTVNDIVVAVEELVK
ncbi:phosphopantetheine-binding protein [Spiroplasma endosymbiont of Othius punctulatus]|uniref:phosphopantetheine-binding protein n=1 Tax=Spiroplasma endosymbiont of Othius punctulatus TaxID=3066289 RepID=UPI0030CD45C8